MYVTPFDHKLKILRSLGIEVPAEARILDYGCGAGATVYTALDLGYSGARGFDVVNYLSLRDPADRRLFEIREQGEMPFSEGYFDLVVSDQVFEHVMAPRPAFADIFRVLKPGGYALHSIPARYQVIEPHVYVPLGGLIGRRWYYKL